MVSTGTYLLSAAALAALIASLAFSAVRLRKLTLPTWQGAPAHLVDAILAIALLTWLAELLGLANLLYAWPLVTSALLLSVAVALSDRKRRVGVPRLRAASSFSHRPLGERGSAQGEKASAQPGHPDHPPTSLLIATAIVALVFAHWGLTTKSALDRGIFNFDSLWYHMPFAVEMANSHSVTGLHHTETVFTNWFYPQNSELLHAVGILLAHRDILSLFINFGWLAIAFLAAWCIGRPYGRGHLTTIAAAIVLECHTLVVREPGAAKNDLMAAALILAAIAILVNARVFSRSAVPLPRYLGIRNSGAEREPGWGSALPVGWPLAMAGLATGLAAGTKFTALAMAAALSVAVLALAPAGRRRAAAAWWFLPAFAAGGFWYLRNLFDAGNPLPEVAHLGPISLPHPERLQSGRPEFSVVHYATDTAVWRDYFVPGLHQAFGLLWPLVVAGAIAGGLFMLLRGRDRVLRWMGAVALFGLLAYLVTPLSAAGAEGAPVAFAINVRFAIPALLVGIVLLPLVLPKLTPPQVGDDTLRRRKRAEAALLGGLLLALLLTDRPDAVLRDPSRLFGLGLATLFVLIPAALLAWRHRHDLFPKTSPPAGGAAGGTSPEEASATAGAGGSPAATGPAGHPPWSLAVPLTTLALAILAIGYPVERSYLQDRFRNDVPPEERIPGMNLDSAYRWARDVHDARIGLAGTTAGFLQYGFYGTDLSNRVRYLGAEGPHGAFNAIPDCRGFRAAVNAAGLDYLVTSPFLNFIHTGRPIPSPEAAWLRDEPAVTPLLRSGPITVWKVRGRLDPSACGPANAPLRRIPQQPTALWKWFVVT